MSHHLTLGWSLLSTLHLASYAFNYLINTRRTTYWRPWKIYSRCNNSSRFFNTRSHLKRVHGHPTTIGTLRWSLCLTLHPASYTLIHRNWLNTTKSLSPVYDTHHSHKCHWPWWRHQMKTFFALPALCEGNPPVTGGFPSQRPVTRSFDVSLVCAWTNGSLSRHCNDFQRWQIVMQ